MYITYVLLFDVDIRGITRRKTIPSRQHRTVSTILVSERIYIKLRMEICILVGLKN